MKKKITQFVLSDSAPSKDLGWLKPLDDGSYGMYVFTKKGWSYVGKSKESVTAIKVNGEDIVDADGVANLQVVKKPKGYVKVYAPNGTFTINGTTYNSNSNTTVYVDTVESITGNSLELELHNVKISSTIFNDGFPEKPDEMPPSVNTFTSLLLDNVDASECIPYRYFLGCQGVAESIKIEGTFDISNMTSIYGMFYYDEKLTSLDLSKWNVSNVKDACSVFAFCLKLSNLDVSGWDTHNMTSMAYMFLFAPELTILDLSRWNTVNVSNMESFLSVGSSKLTSITLGTDFGKMKDETGSVDFSSASGWTKNVSSLTKLYDRKANGMGVITLKLSSATKTALGEAGITTLTNKGYTIA